jgi:hypothetical protein
VSLSIRLRRQDRVDDRLAHLATEVLGADEVGVLRGETTAEMRLGLPSTYSMETWLLPSGRRKFSVIALADDARACWVSLWASEMGSGMSSGVSLQAKPNIRPWSPAPCSLASPSSTPIAMSGDWRSMELSTAQVFASKPMSEWTKPISRTALRAIAG